MLSEGVGWWMLKSIRVHPEDKSKLPDDLSGLLALLSDPYQSDVRQIVESPFLAEPVIVNAGKPEQEEIVTGQILALLPQAVRLRCAQEPGS